MVHGNKAKLKRQTLALLRCESNFKIFELGLIAVQTDFQNFGVWPYCSANWFSKFFGLGLIAVQTEIQNFGVWPYCGANWFSKFFGLGLIVVQIGWALLPCTSVIKILAEIFYELSENIDFENYFVIRKFHNYCLSLLRG